MQTAALRMLPGRQCRHAAAAVHHRQRYAQPRLVKVRVSAEDDQTGYIAVEELQKLEKSGNADFATLDSLRQKYGMKRGVDGRVQLRHSQEGIWYELKLDNEVKGTLLLRNSKNGNVHVLQTDKLEQLDLSDDYLLLLMFADGNWTEVIQPIQIGDAQGNVEDLSVDAQQFRDTVGILKTLEQMEQEDQQGVDILSPGNGRQGGGQEIEVDPSSIRPLN